MADFGDDLEANVLRDLSGDVDPFLPLCVELRKVETAVGRARALLPKQMMTRGLSLIGYLTRVLARSYQEATGLDPLDSERSAFVRGVVVAHDALPPSCQDQNIGLPREQWSKRTKSLSGKVREAVRAMIKDGSLAEYHNEKRRLSGAIDWLDVRPIERDALERLRAAGGSGAVDGTVLPGLIKAGLVQDFSGFGLGLTALAEHALAKLGERPAA